MSVETWRSNELLTKAFNELRLSIDHAWFGVLHAFKGANTLPANRLYFNLEETGEIQWGKNVKVLEKGSVAFMPFNIPLKYNFTGGRMVSFHYNLEIFPNADLFADLTDCFFFHEPELCERVYEIMFKFNNLRDLLSIQLEIITLSRRLLDKDLEFFARQIQLQKKHERLLRIIGSGLDADMNVEKLAALMGMSRNALSKSFNRDMGFPLKKYLTQQLVRKSSHLLLESRTVKEVARELKFSDEFYFSRFFKKHTNMSPSGFMKLPGLKKVTIS